MAKLVEYFQDLDGMPEDGPFVVGIGPVGASTPRIEHARGPDGIGTPQILHPDMYAYIAQHGIPRGMEGADRLNELFEWDGVLLRPVERGTS